MHSNHRDKGEEHSNERETFYNKSDRGRCTHHHDDHVPDHAFDAGTSRIRNGVLG